MKYIVDPKERIEIPILIDTSTNRVLRDFCILTQGQGMCRSKSIDTPCFHKYKTCSSELRDIICTDDIGKMKLDLNHLPKNIIKEVSYWAKESFGLSQMIEQESIEINRRTNDREINVYKLIENRIKYLLKDWTLSNSDPSLKVRLKGIPNSSFDAIEPLCMKEISKADPRIVNAFYQNYMSKIMRGGVEDDSKKEERST